MRRWNFALLALALLPCLAFASQVYRWTDAHGETHFSDAPPPTGVHFKIIDMTTGAVVKPTPKPAVGSSTAAVEPARTASNAETGKQLPDTPANRTLVCKHLASNIKLLDSDRPLTMSPTDPTPMSNDTRTQRLSAARAKFEKTCSLNSGS